MYILPGQSTPGLYSVQYCAQFSEQYRVNYGIQHSVQYSVQYTEQQSVQYSQTVHFSCTKNKWPVQCYLAVIAYSWPKQCIMGSVHFHYCWLPTMFRCKVRSVHFTLLCNVYRVRCKVYSARFLMSNYFLCSSRICVFSVYFRDDAFSVQLKVFFSLNWLSFF